MKTVWQNSGVLRCSLALALVMTASALRADDKAAGNTPAGEVTLTGQLTCGKCTLAETEKCVNVLLVKDGENQLKYYLADGKISKAAHGKVCPPNTKKNAEVVGTVSEKENKKWLTSTKITYVD